jgi:outer membrane protein TolC
MVPKTQLGNDDNGKQQKRVDAFRTAFLAVLSCVAFSGVALISGCTAQHQKRAADREVYKIIEQVEGKIFGRTNQFTIETPYTARKPLEILPAELIADRLQTNRRVLNIDEALRLAVTASRRYQAEKERLYLTALSLTGQRYEFGPQFFAGASGALNRSSDGERSVSIGSDAGASQFFKSGGRLGVNLANDILRFYTGDPRRSVVSSLSMNLVQPLLRGFGRNNPAVESLTQSERNVVYAVRTFDFFQDAYALEIVSDYFALLAQQDSIRNRYNDYQSRVASTTRLAERVDRERVVDVDQARQAELSSKNNYINAVAGYLNQLDQFKIKLGLPLGEHIVLDAAALTEVGQTGLVPVPLDSQEAYRLAVERQMEILNAIDQFEDSKRKIRLASDRFKPDLNLFANASLDSDRPTDYTRFDPDEIRAGVGVELDLPIDRVPDRNNYRATLVSFEAELRSLTLSLDSLRDAIERGMRTLEQRRQNYTIQQNAVELAVRRADATPELVEAGRAEQRDLIEAQDALLAARNALTQALVDYQEARLQLMLEIGALNTDLEKFWLKDHLAGFLGRNSVIASQPTSEDRPVIPPDQFFNN